MMKSAWDGAEGRRGGTGSQPAQPRGPSQAPMERCSKGHQEARVSPLLDKLQAGLLLDRSQKEVDESWNPTP